MKLQIGKRAQGQAERADDWWRENRPAAPDLFARELADALTQLVSAPNAGTPYPTARRPHLRRMLLPRTEKHLYFALEREGTLLAIHAVWGARRSRPPRL